MNETFLAKAEVIVNASRAEVWEALTKPELIKQYLFGTTVTTDWTIGGPVTYTGEWQGKQYQDKGTIEEFVPNEHMVTTYWSSMSSVPDAPENYNTITTELTDADGGTKVTIIQDSNATQEKADHSTQNWTMVLGKMKEMLEKKV